MDYRIEYFREGAQVETVHFSGSQKGAVKAADEGLEAADADFARIVDAYTGAEVDSVLGASRGLT